MSVVSGLWLVMVGHILSPISDEGKSEHISLPFASVCYALLLQFVQLRLHGINNGVYLVR